MCLSVCITVCIAVCVGAGLPKLPAIAGSAALSYESSLIDLPNCEFCEIEAISTTGRYDTILVLLLLLLVMQHILIN